jgi:adenine-specific DNA-methyltransferase
LADLRNLFPEAVFEGNLDLEWFNNNLADMLNAPSLFDAQSIETDETLSGSFAIEGKSEPHELDSAVTMSGGSSAQRTIGSPGVSGRKKSDITTELYRLTWAGKRDAIRLLQIPGKGTLVPVEEESVDFSSTKNVFIEGDNLEVLKLLHKAYLRSAILIYLDPPYNTGKDMVYRDNYSDPLSTYLKMTGQSDVEGNVLVTNRDTAGRYHSNWLSMMYPRLSLARQLLREDGVIFVSIDDHEVHNLLLLMNEVFGEENFIGQITVQTNPRGRQADRFVATVHEYLLLFAKDIRQCSLIGSSLTESQLAEFKYTDQNGEKYRLLGLRQRGSASSREDRPLMFFPLYVNPITGEVSTQPSEQFTVEVLPRKSTGEDGRWMWSKTKVEHELHRVEAHIVDRRQEWDIFVRDYLSRADGAERTRKFKTIWDDKGLNYQDGKEELKSLFEGESPFDFPKPVSLLRRIFTMADDREGLYMDFFGGSATTAQAIFELNRADGGNRRFVIVQLPEPIDSPQHSTIAEIGKERIRRVGSRMKRDDAGTMNLSNLPTTDAPHVDLGFKVFRLSTSNYKSVILEKSDDPQDYVEQLGVSVDPLVKGWQHNNVIWEVALKEGYGLNTQVEKEENIEDLMVYRVVDPEKEQQFFICLEDKVDPSLLKPLELQSDSLFICRDIALDDSAVANLALQCKLKTI